MRTMLLGLVLTLSGVVQTTAMYSSRSSVVSLDPSNFKSTVKSSGVYLVEFYAPWYESSPQSHDSHCHRSCTSVEKASRSFLQRPVFALSARSTHCGAGMTPLTQHSKLQGEPTLHPGAIDPPLTRVS